jgi:hypothetical protein
VETNTPMRLKVIEAKGKCGPCTECCTVVSVRELRKPLYSRCEHLGDHPGCAVYAGRPNSCRDWTCVWLAGLLGEGDGYRPDNSGIVLSLDKREGVLVLDVYEGKPGTAADLSRLEYLVRKINARLGRFGPIGLVLISPHGVGVGYPFDPDPKYAGPGTAWATVTTELIRPGWRRITGCRPPTPTELQQLKTSFRY